MDVSSLEHSTESPADRYPLLTEQMETNNESGHTIDIVSGDRAMSSSGQDGHTLGLNTPHNEDLPSSTRSPTYQTLESSNRWNLRNVSVTRRNDGRRSPMNSGLWLSVELVATLSQIVASIVVLALSVNENPQAPLFAWVVGYASGCVASLPILYWRYQNRNQGMEQNLEPSSHQGSSHSNPSVEPSSYTTISIRQASEEGHHESEMTTRNNHPLRSSWHNGLVDHFKMALDCFFAVWFVVGNVWIFGGHSTASDAPKLYRLCIVFLTISCISYAMPFILCATICCCWPCMISILGIREEFSQNRGATSESIDALPTYKFKLKKIKKGDRQEIDSGEGEDEDEGGILATETGKECTISGEDAVCCICLAKYADNDDLRELPCSHFFHMVCVDKWLKINASCPLCKCEVGECADASPFSSSSDRYVGERRIGNVSAPGGIYL